MILGPFDAEILGPMAAEILGSLGTEILGPLPAEILGQLAGYDRHPCKSKSGLQLNVNVKK